MKLSQYLLVALGFSSSANAERIGDGWGTNIHWTREPVAGEAAQLAQAFKLARMDFSWSQIEKTCGEYNFSSYDDLLSTMEEHGVRPYWILDYGNPCYPPAPEPQVDCTTREKCEATCQEYFNTCDDGWYYCCAKDPQAPTGCTLEHSCASKPTLNSCACGNGTAPKPPPPPASGNAGCDTPECIEAFGKFAAAAADHFKGHGIIWECLNEPNGMGNDNSTTIAALCLSAGKPLAAVGEHFVGPATSGIDMPYLDGAMAAGILAAFDAVSVHPYRSTAPDTVLSDYVSLRALIDSHGKTPAQKALPILSGEWGYTSASLPCNYGNRVDELTQACFLSRMWLSNVLSGISISINYDWSDGTGGASDCESHFGSVRQPPVANRSENPYDPKPKYTAALVLQQSLGNFERYEGRISPVEVHPTTLPPNNVFVLQFDNSTESGSNGAVADAQGFAVWTNGSVVQGTCSAPGHPSPAGWTRLDCGYEGISEDECLSPQNPKGPGCCWEPNVSTVGGPQCYWPQLPTATDMNVSFKVNSTSAPSACWNVVGMLGDAYGQTCAGSDGVVEVHVPQLQGATHNAPVYLLPQ